MRIVDSLIAEIDKEAATTRKMLERIPGDKLSWKPHEKSMTLGQLSSHIANLLGGVAEWAAKPTVDMSEMKGPSEIKSAAEFIPALEKNVATARKILDGMDDATIMASWTLTKDGKVAVEMPRIGLIRTFMLNHWYHHRGQLCVYLRELDVPIPAIYGPSADENPFA